MENKKSIKLIEGEFNVSDAKEILVNLIQSKIQFHEKKEFSSLIRFGLKDSISVKRIANLKKEIVELREFIQDLNEKKHKLIINTTIKIEIK